MKTKILLIIIPILCFCAAPKIFSQGSKVMRVDEEYKATPEELAKRAQAERERKAKQAEEDRKKEEDYKKAEADQKEREKNNKVTYRTYDLSGSGSSKSSSSSRSSNSSNNSVQYNDPIQTTQDAYDKGVNDFSNSIYRAMRTKQINDDLRRKQEKEERMREQEEKRQREQEEMDRENERIERERIERERIETERRNLTNSRSEIFNSYIEADIPLSSSKISLDKLFYFVYSYNKNNIAEQGMTVNVSTPFEIDRRSDGTWPYKNDILSEMKLPYSSSIIFHGYYTSMEEASQKQIEFINNIKKTGGVVQTFNYKGKKSTMTSANKDFWGEPVNKQTNNTSNKTNNNATKKTETDFWGAPLKK